MDRKLASVQKISEIRPIEGADKIQVAMLENLGWECVVKKEEFSIGDKVCYFEVDSVLPERNEFEFLRERKFRIKTIKLRKQVSMGLIMPLSILPKGNYEVGDDITETLGVKKYDVQLIEEQKLAEEKKSKSKILKFFMNFAIFRWIYFKLNSVDRGWPGWGVGKTDEERIQTCAKLFMNNMDKLWYVTEKIDGQSGTFFTHKSRRWVFPHWIFGVCSRNIWLKKKDNSSYWRITDKLDLKNKITSLKEEIVVQGEVAGTAIQKNKYGFPEIDLYVFNVIIDRRKCSINEMEGFCKDTGLKTVPIIDRAFDPKSLGNITEIRDIVHALVKMSNGKSKFADIPREGLVFRLIENPNISFKVINPEFSIKYPD